MTDYDNDGNKNRSDLADVSGACESNTHNSLSNQTPPAQRVLDLFQLDSEDLSNTIDIYDALPKYTYTDRRSKDLSSAETIRSCRLNKTEYKVVIKPAIIKDSDGGNILIYPGAREELVESVLRKFAVDGQGAAFRDEIGVTFSLYQLFHELKKRKHALSTNEIKEAIMVCRGATLECYSSNGETVISSSFFTTAALTTRDDWKKNANAKCMVIFNPLVSKSIHDLTYRSFNYATNMLMNSPLARFLHKKMSHNFKQASTDNAYTIMLVSFLTNSERGLSNRMPENVRAMKNALECLIKYEVVDHYEAIKITKGSATLDVKYIIYPHKKFISDVIQANKNKKQIAINSMKKSIGARSARG